MATSTVARVGGRRVIGACVVVGSVLLIGALTLTPGGGGPRLPVLCVVCDSFAVTDFVANVGLFVPLGVGLALLGLSGARATGLALIASTAIEVVQYIALPGRNASVRDVVANTTGTALGWAIVASFATAVWPSAQAAKRLTAAAVATWFATQLFGAWLEQPSLPVSPYWGQWAPDLGGMRTFEGRLISARLNGNDLPHERAHDSDQLRRDLREQGTNLSIVAVTDRTAPLIAPIAAMYDHESREIFLLGERGRDAVYRVRRRAMDLHLRTPGIELPDAIEANDSLRLEGAFALGRLSLARRDARDTARAEVLLGPWLLWSHFVPSELDFGPWETLAAMAWSFLIVLPVGYWWRLAERRTPVLVVGATAFVGAGMIAPSVLSEPIAPSGIWLASLAGFAAGAVLTRLTDGRHARLLSSAAELDQSVAPS
jgi:hypothetical protein